MKSPTALSIFALQLLGAAKLGLGSTIPAEKDQVLFDETSSNLGSLKDAAFKQVSEAVSSFKGIQGFADIGLELLKLLPTGQVGVFTELVQSQLSGNSRFNNANGASNNNSFSFGDWEYISTRSESGKNYRIRGNSAKVEALGVDKVKQTAGYFDVDDNRHLFYWFFESRNDPKTDPVVLWINGGPGCSSMTGLFFELGPSSINANGTAPILNPYAWNSNASVIFLDQPINVGLSYSDNDERVHSTLDARDDFFHFVDMFFRQYPQYAHLDFHIAGESYGGAYIPAFADRIQSANDKSFNLTSILIGNGITDNAIQAQYYQPMACGKGGYKPVLSEEECDEMLQSAQRCDRLSSLCKSSGVNAVCFSAYFYCENTQLGPYQKTGLNVYDIREQCEDEEALCYPQMNAIEAYMNQDFVMQALGSEVENFTSCSDQVGRDFIFGASKPDYTISFDTYIPPLLESGVSVLIYAGDKDFICNWLGNQAWTNALEWYGSKEFSKADTLPWNNELTGHQAGTFKNTGNFTFLRVFDAGHMVPYNQPENSLDFFQRWIAGDRSF